MKIVKSFITKNVCFQSNQKRVSSDYRNFQDNGVKGLMLHSVGCNQDSAEVFVKLWNKSNVGVAVHAVLQADGTVFQCLPWNYRGWHAGGKGNNTHIGVEMTEPDCIKYTSGNNFTCSNKAEALKQVKGTYKTAVELFAYLCKELNLDPLKDIISHREGHKKGIASNHGDPEHLWRGMGLPYTMDTFRQAVKEAMGGEKTSEEVKKSVEEIAKEVINGKWGNGTARKNALEKAGYNYSEVQTKVNELVKGKSKKTVTEVAKEVINGKWGNGSARKRALTQAGYDYSEVQAKVNELLK